MADSKEKDAQKAPANTTAADWKAEAEYVGFYARVGAALIDSFVLMLPISYVFALLLELGWGSNFGAREAAMVHQTQGDPELARQLAMQFVQEGKLTRWMTENVTFSIGTGLLVIVLWYFFSATPGKMLMGMKIVDAETGMPPNNGQNIIRYLGYFPATLFFALGLFWVFFDKRCQGWHDKMAGTVVVYKKSLPQELASATLSKE
jgi:uncharacterized RDD family membrane protein YckC